MADPGKDAPQGPVDPHGQGGIDAPAPPGGPQRTDAPGGPTAGGDEPPRRPGFASATDEDDEDAPRTEGRDRDLQEENAETSLDQPSQ